MSTSRRRLALLGSEVFVALTAIGGGIAPTTGAEGGRLPRSWLSGTPFGDYPAVGAVVAHETGFSGTLPPYVSVPRNPTTRVEEGRALDEIVMRSLMSSCS